MTDAQKKAMKKALAVMQPFLKLRDTMPSQYMHTFLIIAADEDKNVKTYSVRAGISQSLMTRHLADLGERNCYHTEGMGLLEGYRDLMDRRNVLVKLTAKGHRVVKEICAALE